MGNKNNENGKFLFITYDAHLVWEQTEQYRE